MSEKAEREFLDFAYRRDNGGMRAAFDKGNHRTLYSEDSWGNTALHYAVYAEADTGGSYCKFNPNMPENIE